MSRSRTRLTGSERSSVWVQQEIGVFSYWMFLEERDLPIRVYSEPGIRREGVREVAIVNAIEFHHPDEILVGVSKWLGGPESAEGEVMTLDRMVQGTVAFGLLLGGCASVGGTAGIFDVRSVWYKYPTTGDVRYRINSTGLGDLQFFSGGSKDGFGLETGADAIAGHPNCRGMSVLVRRHGCVSRAVRGAKSQGGSA